MISKKNIIYITVLCVCFAFTLTALVLSFFLGRFFGVLDADDCTSYRAELRKIDVSSPDMVSLEVADAKVWVDDEDEEEEDEEKAAESETAGVSCTILLARHDMVEGGEALLEENATVTFLVKEGEVQEGGSVWAVAMKKEVKDKNDEDIATLDLHESEKLEKVKYTQIGLLCGVLLFFAGGGFCMFKLCSKNTRW